MADGRIFNEERRKLKARIRRQCSSFKCGCRFLGTSPIERWGQVWNYFDHRSVVAVLLGDFRGRHQRPHGFYPGIESPCKKEVQPS